MMKTHNNHLTMKALVLSLLGTAQTVSAVNLNYESLSSLEKPIATHIGDTTISLTGLIDAGIDLKNDDALDLASLLQPYGEQNNTFKSVYRSQPALAFKAKISSCLDSLK